MEQSLINAGQENFSLPHDVVQLPTGGIFYKHKKKSLKVLKKHKKKDKKLVKTS